MRVVRALALASLGIVAAPSSAFAHDPPPIPEDGTGALTLGSMLMVGGAVVTGLGMGAKLNHLEGEAWGVAGTVVGIASVAAGIGITFLGVRERLRYRDWRATTSLRPPPQGYGLLVGGAGLLVGSGAVMAMSVVGLWEGWSSPIWFPAGLGLGGTGIVIGSSLLIAGSSVNTKFERWRSSQARLLPSASFGPNGASFGLIGRF